MEGVDEPLLLPLLLLLLLFGVGAVGWAVVVLVAVGTEASVDFRSVVFMALVAQPSSDELKLDTV